MAERRCAASKDATTFKQLELFRTAPRLALDDVDADDDDGSDDGSDAGAVCFCIRFGVRSMCSTQRSQMRYPNVLLACPIV